MICCWHSAASDSVAPSKLLLLLVLHLPLQAPQRRLGKVCRWVATIFFTSLSHTLAKETKYWRGCQQTSRFMIAWANWVGSMIAKLWFNSLFPPSMEDEDFAAQSNVFANLMVRERSSVCITFPCVKITTFHHLKRAGRSQGHLHVAGNRAGPWLRHRARVRDHAPSDRSQMRLVHELQEPWLHDTSAVVVTMSCWNILYFEVVIIVHVKSIYKACTSNNTFKGV